MTTVNFEVGKDYVYSKSYDSGFFTCVGRTSFFVLMKDKWGETFRTKIKKTEETKWTKNLGEMRLIETGQMYLAETGRIIETTSTGTLNLSYLSANEEYESEMDLPVVHSL